MKPDNPKEYMISYLKDLLELVEQDKIILNNVQENPISFPNPRYEYIVRGRRITLEIYYATEN